MFFKQTNVIAHTAKILQDARQTKPQTIFYKKQFLSRLFSTRINQQNTRNILENTSKEFENTLYNFQKAQHKILHKELQ